MSRLLAIDAGNTRIKWGLREGAAWSSLGSIATAEAAALSASLATHGTVTRAIAANVAGAQVELELSRACAQLGAKLEVVRPAARSGDLSNGYRDPGQLGPDRWAALVAARGAGAGPKVVATAGTALTVDALSGTGAFLGGLIVPGPALMRRALTSGTAGLRDTEGRFTDFPASTPDAITSGAIQACVGAILRMVESLERREGSRPALVLSGGAASEIAPHLAMAHEVRENLVLEGLVRLAEAG